ncbi:putative homeodomain-like protein [Tanacetum coccineum]
MEESLSGNKTIFKKGAWSEEEDHKLRAYIQRYGHWNWGLVLKFAGTSHFNPYVYFAKANYSHFNSHVLEKLAKKWEEL